VVPDKSAPPPRYALADIAPARGDYTTVVLFGDVRRVILRGMDRLERLGIELPIIQAPMAGVQGSALAIVNRLVREFGPLSSVATAFPLRRRWSHRCARRRRRVAAVTSRRCGADRMRPVANRFRWRN
jgi:hypothetical protein